jgi:hypothetical protein
MITKWTAVFLSLIVNIEVGKAQINWNNASSNAEWYNASNWLPNTGPGEWLSTTAAGFNNAGPRTVGIDFSQGNLSLAKITTGFTVGGGFTPGDIVVGNSSATAGTLTLNGDVNNVILSTFNAPLYIQNNNTGTGKTMDIALVLPMSTIASSAGTITVESNITGAGKGLDVVVGSLGGTVQFTGANTYTGITNISGGGGSNSITLILNHPGGGTLHSGNDVSVGIKALLQINTDQTLSNVTINGQGNLSIGDGATLTITNKLTTGPGRVSVTGTGRIVYAPGATLEYNAPSGSSTSSAEFPVANGPTNVVAHTGNPVLNLHETRTITGSFAGGPLNLKGNDFTASSVIIAGDTYVVTDGLGKLFITGIGALPVVFPVYPSLSGSNFVTVANGQGLTYGVRVEQGITPVLATSNSAVNRTWYIQPFATPASFVNVSFAYGNTNANAGFSYTAPVGLLQYTTSWNPIQANITQVQPVSTIINTLTGGVSSAFAIQNLSGPLAIEPIEISAVKQNNNAEIHWAIHIATAIQQTELERSADGSAFTALTIAGNNVNSYTDDKLLNGTNYYRIKVTDINGRINYNKIIAVINKASGFDIVNLLPNIVTDAAVLNVTSAQQTKMNVVITDMMGHKIQESAYALVAGSNQFSLNLAHLAAGTYQISGYTADGFKKTIRFVKQ